MQLGYECEVVDKHGDYSQVNGLSRIAYQLPRTLSLLFSQFPGVSLRVSYLPQLLLQGTG